MPSRSPLLHELLDSGAERAIGRALLADVLPELSHHVDGLAVIGIEADSPDPFHSAALLPAARIDHAVYMLARPHPSKPSEFEELLCGSRVRGGSMGWGLDLWAETAPGRRAGRRSCNRSIENCCKATKTVL